MFTYNTNNLEKNKPHLPNKEEFKTKLQKYIQTHKDNGRNFNNELENIPITLSTLLYENPLTRWTKSNKKQLIDILTGNDQEEKEAQLTLKEEFQKGNLLDRNEDLNLYDAVPECGDFFDWLKSDFTIAKANKEITSAQKNIIELFIQSVKIPDNSHHAHTEEKNNKTIEEEEPIEATIKKIEEKTKPDLLEKEKFKERVETTRHHFRKKIQEFISPTEYTYLFKYTHLSVRRLNEQEEGQFRERLQGKDKSEIEEIVQKRNVLQINLPLSSQEMMILEHEGKTPYSMKKFDTEFLPRFDTLLKKQIGNGGKNWIYTYTLLNGESYKAREEDIGRERYQEFLEYEHRRSDLRDKDLKNIQGSLFKRDFSEHSGNTQAKKLLDLQLENRKDIYRESNNGICIQSNGKIEKKDLIENFIERAKEEFPFIRIGKINAKKFAEEFLGEYKPSEKENIDTKMNRVKKRIEKKIKGGKVNVFIIENIDELENKIITQKTFLREILGLQNCKFIITSNKDIIRFPLATIKEGTDKFEKGFLPDLLEKIETFSKTNIQNPDPKTCGDILYNTIKNRYPDIKFPQSIIQGIGRHLPDPTIHNAIIDEIMLKCNKGKEKITIEMAVEIIQTRKGNFKPELDDVHKIVEKYINEEEASAINRTATERGKTIKKYTIYLIKDLAHKKYTNEEIANYLKISVPLANKYFNDASMETGLIAPIKEKIEKSLNNKEGIMLLFD